MIKINASARYPLEFIKGTATQREELAKTLNNNFFKNISEKFKSKDISFDVFQKTLTESNPYKTSITILESESKKGYCELRANENLDSIAGFNIYLQPNPFSKEIPLTTADLFMHETAHYFSFMTNPKKIARAIKMYETGLNTKTNDFYDSILYAENNLTRDELIQKLDELLNTLKPNERIEFLQASRYKLKDELFAFKEGEKYQDLIQEIHQDKICCKVDSESYSDFNFETKIKILEEKLAEELKKCRNSNV